MRGALAAVAAGCVAILGLLNPFGSNALGWVLVAVAVAGFTWLEFGVIRDMWPRRDR